MTGDYHGPATTEEGAATARLDNGMESKKWMRRLHPNGPTCGDELGLRLIRGAMANLGGHGPTTSPTGPKTNCPTTGGPTTGGEPGAHHRLNPLRDVGT